MTLTTFSIESKDLALVKRMAKSVGVSKAELIRRALVAYAGKCPTCGRPFEKKGGRRGKAGK